MPEILTLDFPLHPDVDVRDASVESYWSADDADVIVITTQSSCTANYRNHSQHEIEKALQDGKTVFLFITCPHHSSDLLPFHLPSPEPAEGDVIKLAPKGKILANFFRLFDDYCCYNERFPLTDDWTPLLLTGARNRAVAIMSKQANGHFFVLPELPYFADLYESFLAGHLSEDRKQHFKKTSYAFIQELLRIHSVLSPDDSSPPPPDWAKAPSFQTPRLQIALARLPEIDQELNQVQTKHHQATAEVTEARELQLLLYANGKPLERAVLKALRLFGFHAERFADPDSEFDAIFTCQEMRMLGEAEGRDNGPIDVDKMRQLCTNLDEDFARPDVTAYAKGVLFGNPQRLRPPSKRKVNFTAKCLHMAEQRHIALVLTPSLFKPAAYLEHNPDEDYAKACRDAIYACSGAIAQLPDPPDK